jgi:hypothetical protein
MVLVMWFWLCIDISIHIGVVHRYIYSYPRVMHHGDCPLNVPRYIYVHVYTCTYTGKGERDRDRERETQVLDRKRDLLQQQKRPTTAQEIEYLGITQPYPHPEKKERGGREEREGGAGVTWVIREEKRRVHRVS